ncbi:family 43 glycosylhydrolase [Echinicola soli]|uniref:Family 43 glycosylhydrolase n=2 Tax=Echinicola soli TaxID=2591634 RepID=A0A514CJA3_9BACT|nr:family 43 glycosylhydrolase [Echinicola soli]
MLTSCLVASNPRRCIYKNILVHLFLVTGLMAFLLGIGQELSAQQQAGQVRKAPAPMYRDPIYDGAADPVMVWNRQERSWWMLYTTRRANMPTQDVSAYYGTKIGIASTKDHGQTWVFRGYLNLEFERGWNTFWAPEVIYHDGQYHMFVSYIQGVRSHWGGASHIHHYTSENLWDWSHQGPLTLSSDEIIDATIFKMDNGKFRIWYKDDSLGGITMVSESDDLMDWETKEAPAIGGDAHEGPKVFEYQGYYWMLTDEWHGMRVYRSDDLKDWTKQGLVLDKPSEREDDTPSGAHGDVLVFGDKAFVFYFTHPGRSSHSVTDPNKTFHENHRTTIQVAPLIFDGETLKDDRSNPFDFYLPDGK